MEDSETLLKAKEVMKFIFISYLFLILHEFIHALICELFNLNWRFVIRFLTFHVVISDNILSYQLFLVLITPIFVVILQILLRSRFSYVLINVFLCRNDLFMVLSV